MNRTRRKSKRKTIPDWANSNRSGHLAAIRFVGILVAVAGAVSGNQLLLYTGLAAPFVEILMSPDHDHHARKISGGIFKRLWLMFWDPFKHIVPHRSPLSHSLLIGTPARIGYLLFLPTLIVSLVHWEASLTLLGDVWSNPHWAFMNLKHILTEWGKVWGWLPMAALLSDTVHLIKDGYYPWEWPLGRRW